MTDLEALSTAIATHLPPWQDKGWTAVCESDYYRLKHPDGPWLTVYLQKYPNREQLNVCGSFSTAPGTENNFEDLCDRLDHQMTQHVKGGINLSPERNSQALARDIQRRLLSVYLPLYQRGLAARQSKQAALNEKEALLQRIADELGVGTYSETLVCRGFGAAAPHVWGEISVNSAQSLTVKLVGLSPDLWSKLLGVLKGQSHPTNPPASPSP